MRRLPVIKRMSHVLLVVLALASGFAAGSVFVAYGASNNTYHACITPKGDIYRVRQNSSWSCLSGDTKISWSQQGLPGPAGPKGKDGAPGEQGPPGEPGQVSVRTVSVDIPTIPSTEVDGAVAPCDVDEVAIGGGFTLDATLTASFPQVLVNGPVVVEGVATSWEVRIRNGAASDLSGLTAYASCLSVATD